MGYTTEFQGQFDVTPTLKPEHITYLKKFNKTRRMKRNPQKVIFFSDPVREKANLPVGEDGEYFVGGLGFMGQDKDESVLNHNQPPTKQPGLWCHWIPSDDGNRIEWDEGEKFYSYVPWINYLIQHFFKPWGYTLNGEVHWQGEDLDDRGLILIVNNEVATKNH